MASNTPRPRSRSPAAPDRTYQPRRPPSPVRREVWAQPLTISTNMAGGSQPGTASGPGNITSAPLLAIGAPETVAGDGVMKPRRRHHTTRHYQFEECDLTAGAYNCEGFRSAFMYIVDKIMPACDILVVSESWLSRAEDAYAPRLLHDAGRGALQVFQSFTMETPPGAGE